MKNFRFVLRTVTLSIVIINLACSTNAQETINVKGAKGVAVIAGSISFEAASREALNQAKVDALRKAGVTEHLQSYEMLFQSQLNNDYSQFFSSDVQAELQGAVKHFEIVNTETVTDPNTKYPVVNITIDATVILYSTQPDPTFSVRIEGIKGIYEVGEQLKFSVFTTQKCYLHIFAITDTYTNLMYPNPWEKYMEIPANKKIAFPFEQIIDYTLDKNTKNPELNRIVFVFTKDPVRYINYNGDEQLTNSDDIFSWIYGLMPDKRKIDYQVFTVR
jgi:hypothetical protein